MAGFTLIPSLPPRSLSAAYTICAHGHAHGACVPTDARVCAFVCAHSKGVCAHTPVILRQVLRQGLQGLWGLQQRHQHFRLQDLLKPRTLCSITLDLCSISPWTLSILGGAYAGQNQMTTSLALGQPKTFVNSRRPATNQSA